ncbi:MAG: nitrate ABC transporter substrate-binding protein, partial [Candidatus Electrothrix sp. AUS1_2]|nr:nitrate ABC transporter substrate-binding protein [Candidatus Electrothrix sp. AUS1_2]
MYEKRTPRLSVLLCSLLYILTALTSGQAEEQAIRYRLKWLFNTSVAGDIYADKAGYFARQGLRVTVRE